jgi:hypothetical protein
MPEIAYDQETYDNLADVVEYLRRAKELASEIDDILESKVDDAEAFANELFANVAEKLEKGF